MYNYIEDVNNIIIEIEKNIKNKDFYIPKINKFFTEFMNQPFLQNKEIKDINSHDVLQFLNNSKETKNNNNNYNNYRSALKKFFDYTYQKNLTVDVMKGIPKKSKQIPEIQYLSDLESRKIEEYIGTSDEQIFNRILIALFYYSGFSRKHITKLTFGCFDFENSSIQFDSESSQKPIHPILNKLIHDYKESLPFTDSGQKIKVVPINSNNITEKVKNITKKIIGKPIKPTIFSNTFIRNALNKNDNNLVLLSEYLMEDVTTIYKHVNLDEDIELYNKQKVMVDEIFNW